MRLTTGNLIVVIVCMAIAGAVIGIVVPAVRESRRPDVADAADLARRPYSKLRDSEIETLVRAAFREADAVEIDYEGSRKTALARNVVITDPQSLEGLAHVFALGHDGVQLPLYPYPGMMYTQVKFDGPYKPDFVFTSSTDVYFFKSHTDAGSDHRLVRAEFTQALAEKLGLVADDAPH